ncbi:MAG: SpoIIE family protein phosphatase [Candidatus Fermentibacteraceae bacterium]
MNSVFRLLVITEKAPFPAGADSVAVSEVARIQPPRWADEIVVHQDDPTPDAVLMVLNGQPSAPLRYCYFSHYRRKVPIAAIAVGSIESSDRVVTRLEGEGLLWRFNTVDEVRQLVSNQVASWISAVRRDKLPYPSGGELLAGWGDLREETLDPVVLSKAESILQENGFLCLSGPLGSGKTTLGRILIARSAQAGMLPIELVEGDVNAREVDHLLRGPEDCAILFDLDSMRRYAGDYPAHLWHVFITTMARATDKRRRLVVASSSSKMEAVFSLFDDKHLILPKPAERRSWRLREGERAMARFWEMDPFGKASMILLSLFEPIVPESVFKRAVLEAWERLSLLLNGDFTGVARLEALYADSDAFKGNTPFRRLELRGEMHLCAGDTTIMAAVDRGARELSREGSPVVKAVFNTLLGSHESALRRAGFALVNHYSDLSAEMKAALLFAASRETEPANLGDFFNSLLLDRKSFDSQALGLCRFIVESGSENLRVVLARSLAMYWVRRDERMQDILQMILSDPSPAVRQFFMYGMETWSVGDDPGGYYLSLLEDGSSEVMRQVLVHIGGRFPDMIPQERKVLNAALERGNPEDLRFLAQGLTNRRLEGVTGEVGDLLWLLIQRLKAGGRSLVAFQLGSRIRYLSREVREAMIADIPDADRRGVAQYLLMNYQWLDRKERHTLWRIVTEQMPKDRPMAEMVLPYLRIIEPYAQLTVIVRVLSNEAFGGREALSRLLSSGRTDIADVSMRAVERILESRSVEARAKLPWFLLWNRDSLGPEAGGALRTLAEDASPTVRAAVASAARLLGLCTEETGVLLELLSGDQERAVRAAAGEAGGEFWGREETRRYRIAEKLINDSDSFVRLRTFSGFFRSVNLSPQERMPLIARALGDTSAPVRLEALWAVEHLGCVDSPALEEHLADLLTDPAEDVRLAAVSIVTRHPDITNSSTLRAKMPDLFLGRLDNGGGIAGELSTARRIQYDLMPAGPPSLDGYDIASYYRPAREVGGDYYDFFTLSGNNLGLAVADVTGKGIPAALTMAGLKGSLSANVQSIFSISEVMFRVNNAMLTGTQVTGLIGLFYGVLNIDSGRLTYVNAGHNPPLLVKRGGETVILDTGGLILGFKPDVRYDYGVLEMKAGDVLVLYTDGITETMDPEGNEFTMQGLIAAVMRHMDLGSTQIVRKVLEEVQNHGSQAPQADDRTLVIVKHR